MEKLLHERLRDAFESCPSGSDYVKVGDESVEMYGYVADNLAAEIEKCYIPRPRFEDGEPVQFGDDIEIHNRSGLLDKGIIQSFHPNKGTVWMLSLVGCDHERLVRFDPETCVIKRPTPKVLDADGVPCKRGDRVYPINQKVYSDADGYIVDHTEVDDGINSPRVYFIDDVGMSWMKASELTHREPDTLERIEDDATMLPYAYCLEHRIELSDAPSIEETTIAMVHDLLRRQREVLKCDQSS